GIGFQAVRSASVDGDRLIAGRVTPNHSCHNGFPDRRCGKRKYGSKPLEFLDVFATALELHLQIINLMLQPFVFLMDTDQREVVTPYIANPVCHTVDKLLYRSKRVDDPDSNKASIEPAPCLNRDQPRLNDEGNRECYPDGFGGSNNPVHSFALINGD